MEIKFVDVCWRFFWEGGECGNCFWGIIGNSYGNGENTVVYQSRIRFFQ
jgi:hypothetical protein